jgi:anti-sigma factor RsiW
MNHPPQPRLSARLDDDLAAAERAAIDAHLEECAACRELLEELREVGRRARALAVEPPSRDLWPGIAGAIGQAPRGVTATRRARPALALAAALALVAVGLAIFLGWQEPQKAPVASTAQPGDAPGGSDPVVAAYDRAIAELRSVYERSGLTTTPEVRGVLAGELEALDRAASEMRHALRADPSSPWLRQQLERTLDQQLRLLQNWTDLIAEVRS